MKSITINLLKFAIFFTLGSILFRYGLSWSIANDATFSIWIISIIYFIFNFGIGWFFGKKDYESFPLIDIGVRFHLTTYLIFNVVGELWFLMGLQSSLESIKSLHLTAIIWGIFLLMHFIVYLFTRKNTIRGLDKSELFE